MGSKCALCGYDKCADALDLHHIDPTQKEFNISARSDISWQRTANELKKCILLCANCHREIHSTEQLNTALVSSFNQDICDEVTAEIEAIKIHTDNRCCDCGKIIDKKASRCLECANKYQRKIQDRPSKQELALLIAEHGFLGVGKKYSVSDNAIRKWCKAEGLPTHKNEICQYAKTLKQL